MDDVHFYNLKKYYFKNLYSLYVFDIIRRNSGHLKID